MGIFEQSPGETLLLQRNVLAHDAGQEPDAGVDQRDRRRLAARKHEIAEAQLLDPARLDHPLVDALETSAQQPHARTRCQFPHAPLLQRLPARAEQEKRTRRRRAGDRRVDDIGPEHHARPAAEGRVVNGAVFIARESADVHCFQAPNSLVAGLAGERKTQRPGKHFREQGQHGGGPGGGHARRLFGLGCSSSPSGGATVSSPPDRSTLGTVRRVKGTITLPPSGRAISRLVPPPKSNTASRARDSSRPRAGLRARPDRADRIPRDSSGAGMNA